MKSPGLRDVHIARCSGERRDGALWHHIMRLPTPDGYFTHPEISRCANKVAFWGICDDLWDIWYCTLSSLELHNISNGDGTNCHPSWSPDGQFIAYSHSAVLADSFDAYGSPWKSRDPQDLKHADCANAYRDIWVYDLESRERRQLTHLGGDTERPAWSPDGRAIAYVVSDGVSQSIGIHTIESNEERMVVTGDVRYYRPAWDPSGRRLACNNKGPGDHVLWLCNVDGSGLRQLTKRPLGGPEIHDHGPWWSSDGNSILFHSDRGGAWGLWTVDVQDGTLHRMTVSNFTSVSHGTWDEAEKTLGFDSSRNHIPKIHKND